MRYQAPTTRRTTTKRTDENAVAAVKGVKATMAHLPPAQKASAAGLKKPVPVKAGAKRTALGSVVPNGPERQPLAVQTDANQDRPIAPVPSRAKPVESKIQLIEDELMEEASDEEEEEEDDEDWLRMTQQEAEACEAELQRVHSTFTDEVDLYDTTMVAEYADDIFAHMEQLEVATLPHARYMDFQTEIEW